MLACDGLVQTTSPMLQLFHFHKQVLRGGHTFYCNCYIVNIHAHFKTCLIEHRSAMEITVKVTRKKELLTCGSSTVRFLFGLQYCAKSETTILFLPYYYANRFDFTHGNDPESDRQNRNNCNEASCFGNGKAKTFGAVLHHSVLLSSMSGQS